MIWNTKRINLIHVLSLLLLGCAPKAPVSFQQLVGGSEMDRGVYVSPTRDGGYVSVGVTESSGAGGEDIYLVRSDAAGHTRWTRTFGGPDEDNGWSVLELDDGFIIAGFTNSFGAGGFDFWLIRTDPLGQTLWQQTYGGPLDDRCWAMVQTSDGGFLLTGETRSRGRGEEDFYVVRTDSQGTLLWEQSYGDSLSERCFAVAESSDGGFMLAGQSYSLGAGDRDAYIGKIDSEGVLEWYRTAGGAESDVAHGITRTIDGHFLVTGYTTSLATDLDDPYVIKIDAAGNFLFERVVELDGFNHTITGAQASDGGFYLVGFSDYPERRQTAGLLVKLTAGGELDWFEDILPTHNGRSMGYTVQALAQGGCVFTGHTTEGSKGSLDLLLWKTGPR